MTPTSPGYRSFAVAPQFPARLDRVATSLDTVRGRIGCSWARQAASVLVTVTVPPTAVPESNCLCPPGDLW
ncbi:MULTISPECIES: alpha-L-rhamnosidase C-terminal domain-containing protein [unclassified Streptomyces]|uniref:alpha-L-rhamnosidase C-terminal domain-containing protein n=1 Tax=unclassified Streptomyces TaxID=2593676 RepID=UPI00403D1CDB